MTRLAVIGSSHVGCVRQCDDQIRATHPGLELAYFALPGAPFRRAARDQDGDIFRAYPDNPREAALVEKINGATEIDLGPFDHIWVIGHRYGMGRILRLFMKFDVLEMGRTGQPRTVSEAFMTAAMAGEIAASCARIKAQFGDDARITCSAAAYPAQKARQPGKFHEPPLAHILTHPDRDAIFARFEDQIGKALAAEGYGHLRQPADTLAAPFATQTRFLRDARDFRDTSREAGDLRHMNAEYGFRLFQAYAEQVLTAAPSAATHQTS